MGRVKEYWLDLQDEEKEGWIRDRLENEDADESSKEWLELSNKYNQMVEDKYHSIEMEEEYKWYKKRRYTKFHDQFVKDILDLRGILEISIPNSYEEAHFKMIYAHAVTILESYLGDTIKSLIAENNIYTLHAVIGINELKTIKPTLEEIALQDNIVLNKTLKWMSELIFHNIPKVVRIYESILDTPMNLDLEPVSRIADIRHDIVHRNGKTIDGDTIKIDKKAVDSAITVINEFAKDIQAYVNESWASFQDEEGFTDF